MSFDRTLALRLQLVADFGAATKQAASQLQSISKSLKEIQGFGSIKLDGLDTLTVSAGKAATSVGNLATKTRTAQKAAADLATETGAASQSIVGSTALAVQSVGNLVQVYNRVRDAANRAAIAAAGLNTVARQLGTISLGGAMVGELSAIGTAALGATGEVRNLQRALGETRLAMLGPGSSGGGYRAIPLPGGTSMPPSGPRIVGEPGPRGGAIVPYGSSPITGYYGGSGSGGSGGGGGGIPGGGGGKFDFFGGAKKVGGAMQGAGFGQMMAGGMIIGALGGAMNQAADLQDMLNRTVSTMKDTPGIARDFNAALLANTQTIGVPMRDAIAGGYTFLSSLPSDFNMLHKNSQAAAKEMYKIAMKMSVAGGSSAAPFSPGQAAFDMNTAFVQHFKMSDARDPALMLRDYKKISDTFINLENTTSTTVPMIGQSLKAMGPIAEQMGLSFAQSAGLIGILAKGGVRGAPAGYSVKRLLSREAAPTGQLQKIQEAIYAKTGDNIGMYKGGNIRDFYKWLESIDKAEQKMNPEHQAFVNQKLSGLYAISQFDQLIKFTHDQGGAKGLEKYSQSLTKSGSLKKAYAVRTQDNVKLEETKTANVLDKTALDTLKAATPDLIAMMKTVQSLIKDFDHLSPGAKRAFIDIGLLGGAALLASGSFNLIFGTIAKTVGSIGGIINFGKAIMKWEPAIAMFSGIGRGALALGGAILELNPIVLGITAVVALFAIAWNRDWFGIREKTAAEVQNIKNNFAIMVTGTKNFINECGAWFKKFGPTIVTALEVIFPLLGMLDPRFRAKALDFLISMKNGAVEGAQTVLAFFKNLGTEVIQAVMGWAGGIKNAGKAVLDNLGKGISDGVSNIKSHVKGALTAIRNLLPGSEPKDSSSPLYGLNLSGRAMLANFADGINQGKAALVATTTGALDGVMDAIEHGSKHKKKAKGKKAKGPVHDAIIDIKTESLAEIEKMTTTLEAELLKAGAHLKNIGVTFIKNGHVVGRMQADPKAVHMAMGKNPHDMSARNAKDWLTNNPLAGIETKLAAMHKFWQNATDAHVKTMIFGMITNLQKNYDAATKKLEAGFYGKNGTASNVTGGSVGKLNNAFGQAEGDDTKFVQLNDRYNQLLEQRVNLRKNKDLPTYKELVQEEHLETAQLTHLNILHEQEEKTRKKIALAIDDLKTKIAGLNDNDANQAKLKKALTAQLDDYNLRLTTLDQNLEQEAQIIGTVNDKIKANTQAMKDAASSATAWERALVDATQKAGKAALDQLVNTFDAGIDKMLENAFGKWKGKGVSGTLKSAIGDFFATFISELLHSAVNNLMKYAENTLTSFFQSMINKLSSGGGGGGGGFLSFLGSIFGGGGSSGLNLSNYSLSAAGGLASPQEALQNIQGGGGGGVGFSSFASMGSNFLSHLMKDGTIGKGTLGSLALGIAAGQIFGSLMGGGSHNTWGSIGGAVGSIFGPVGSVVGAAVGSLFGHADNPATMPDKYDTARYTQFVGELTGSASTAYGPSYDKSTDQVAQALGGKSELQYIQDFIKAHLTSGTKAEQDEAKKLLGLYGTTGGGENGLIHGKDIGQVQVAGGSLSGTYVDVHNAANDAVTAIQNLTAASQQAADQMGTDAQRMADSFSTLMWGGPSGFSIPALLGGSTGQPGQGRTDLPGWKQIGTIASNLFSSLVPTSGVNTPGANASEVHFHILENSSVSSSQLVDEIIAILPQLKIPLTNAVNQRQYQNSRLRGDTVSVI